MAPPESTVKSLTNHLEKKTSLESLQHWARAHIRPDDDFRRDTFTLKSEQEYVQALITFNNHNIKSLGSALRKEEQIKASKTDRNGTLKKKKTAVKRLAP